ncbi:MAG: DUF58 domain-containing protein [Planctomycetota bacterium]
MRVRPTELGWKGILLLVALTVAFYAAAYSNPFFLILVFCAVLGGLGAVWTAANLRGLGLELPRTLTIAAGAEHALPAVVDAGPRHRAFALELQLQVGGALCTTARAAVVAGRTQLSATLPPLPRGVHAVGTARFASRFPFGLFVASRDVAADLELVVHPRLLDARACPTGDVAGDGRQGQRGGRGTVVRSLRPFRGGDSVGDVHWKATARRGAPVVKEREPEAAAGFHVALDLRLQGDAFERELSRAATLLVRAVATGRPARLGARGLDLAVRDQKGLARALRWLATAAPEAAHA